MARDLKIGLNTGYWGAGPPPGAEEAIAEAERLGYDSIWTAEAYGSDVLTPLAWWGSHTERVRLGTAIMQMSARTPAAAAMAAMTMDHLSGGRFILGLGVSGPQVVEGWYGQPFAKPLARTREYVAIVRDICSRGDRVTADGPHYPLPYPDGTGLGKPLKSTLHPVRERIPIFLGAEGPKNVALAGEIGDGWLALFFSPKSQGFYRDALSEGFARGGSEHPARSAARSSVGRAPEPESPARSAARSSVGRAPKPESPFDSFEVAATVPLIVHDDVEAAADMLRPMYALYFGGMGAKGANFHNDVPRRMGYEAEAETIQDLYLEGKKDEAAAAVPTALVEELALIGPEGKIRHDLDAWRESIATTLLVGGDAAMVRTAAELVLG